MTGPVFISHSSRDAKIANAICDAIERRGMACWISGRDVGPGENFGDAIVDAIERSQAMVLVFSSNANNSEEIKKELALASQHRVTVIPVRVEDIAPSQAYRYELATRQWIDMFVDWDQALKRLTDKISAIQAAGQKADEGGAVAPSPRPIPIAAPAPSRFPLKAAIAGGAALVLAAAGGAFLLTRPAPEPGFVSSAPNGLSSPAQPKPAAPIAVADAASARVAAPASVAVAAEAAPAALANSAAAASAPPPAASSSPLALVERRPEPAQPQPPTQKAAAVEAPAQKIAAAEPPVQKAAVVEAPAQKIAAADPPAQKIATADPPAQKIAAADPPVQKAAVIDAPAQKVATVEPPAALVAQPVAAPPAAAVAQPIVTASLAQPAAQVASAASPPAAAPAPKAEEAPRAPSPVADASAPAPKVEETPRPAAPIVTASLTPTVPTADAAKSDAAKTDASKTFKDCENCPELVAVPAGSALIGSPLQEAARLPSERPPSAVAIPAPLAVARYDITFDDWDACVSEGGCGAWRPGDFGWGRGKQPVIFVSWNDAQNYLAWINKKTGKNYRLLSESEWEYAARGCATTSCPNKPFWFGTINPDVANYDSRFAYDGSPKALARRRATPADVGPPNPFGLVNMQGNVRQWVEDCWDPNPAAPPAAGAARLDGDCSARVTRGGSFADKPQDLRAAARSWETTDARSQKIGFRIARPLFD